jgi:hypothetical protein
MNPEDLASDLVTDLVVRRGPASLLGLGWVRRPLWVSR